MEAKIFHQLNHRNHQTTYKSPQTVILSAFIELQALKAVQDDSRQARLKSETLDCLVEISKLQQMASGYAERNVWPN